MTIQVLQSLIDKTDNFEIVGDQIAAILVVEVANQMALATAAAEDPNDYKLRVYRERVAPWSVVRGPPEPPADVSPIVNVWFDTQSTLENASDVSGRQRVEAVYNIDCYGYGISSESGAGHVPGDQAAAREAHRAMRLVRNIIMASINTYLQLRGTVGQRMITSLTVFQPQSGNQPVENIVGARLALRVLLNETSPQTVGGTLETLAMTVRRAEDGEIVLQAQYDTPFD